MCGISSIISDTSDLTANLNNAKKIVEENRRKISEPDGDVDLLQVYCLLAESDQSGHETTTKKTGVIVRELSVSLLAHSKSVTLYCTCFSSHETLLQCFHCFFVCF